MQFHREFQSFLCDHIPLRKSIAWQDWYAKWQIWGSGRWNYFSQWSLEVIPNPCSEFCHSVHANSQFKHFLKTSLEAVWFNHVPVLLWCDLSDSCYYLSAWTGAKKSLMLDIRKERGRMWPWHSPVTHHPRALRIFQPFPFLTNILIFLSSAASSNMRYQLSLKCN